MDTTGIDAPPPENEPLVVVGTEGAESPPELEPRPRRIGLAVTAAVAVIAALAIPSILLTQDDAPPTDTTIDVTTTIAAPTTTVSTTTSPSTTTTTEAPAALAVEGFELVESDLPIYGLREVRSLGDGFVGVSGSPRSAYFSAYGITWTKTEELDFHWHAFDASADGAILYGHGRDLHIIASRDGLTWTETTSSDSDWEFGPEDLSSFDPRDAVALRDGAFLVSLTRNYGRKYLVLHSADGDSWEATLEVDQPTDCSMELVGTETFVLAIAPCAPSQGESPAAWLSHDGRTWAKTSHPSELSIARRFGFVASGDQVIAWDYQSRSIAVTEDGVTWKEVEMATYGRIVKFTQAGDRFFALTADLGYFVLTSTDGMSWTRSELGTQSAVSGVVADMVCEYTTECSISTQPHDHLFQVHQAGDRHFLVLPQSVQGTYREVAKLWPWIEPETCPQTPELVVPYIWQTTDLVTWEPIPDTAPLAGCERWGLAAAIADGDSYLFITDEVWRWTPQE